MKRTDIEFFISMAALLFSAALLAASIFDIFDIQLRWPLGATILSFIWFTKVMSKYEKDDYYIE